MFSFIPRTILLTISCLLCLACTHKNKEAIFHPEGNPTSLSKWNLFQINSDMLAPNTDVVPYTLNSALFSDYAHKFRTITVPKGESSKLHDDGTIDFPIGTIVSKTFYYPKQDASSVKLTSQQAFEHNIDLTQHRLIETRLLVKRKNSWVALPYIWNEEQTEATLERFGKRIELTGQNSDLQSHQFSYIIPDVNQCAACHQWDMDKDIQPIGLQVRHLNGDRTYGHKVANQLDAFTQQHILSDEVDHLTLPSNADSFDITADPNSRARAYLDINCAHCHNPQGPANTSGLHLEAFRELGNEVGICKLPIAAGSGTGDRMYDIHPGKAQDSIFSYRLATRDADKMMPELGRTLVHDEGVELIDEWINNLVGSCIISQ